MVFLIPGIVSMSLKINGMINRVIKGMTVYRRGTKKRVDKFKSNFLKSIFKSIHIFQIMKHFKPSYLPFLPVFF